MSRANLHGRGFQQALGEQLAGVFIAVFSFAMGVLLTPALLLNDDHFGEAVLDTGDYAPFGALPGDHYLMIRKVEQNIMNSDVGRFKRLIQLEAVLLREYIERPKIAKTFNRSIDTIKRDIQTLIEMGSDAEYTQKRGWRASTAVFVANTVLEPRDDELYVTDNDLDSGDLTSTDGNPVDGSDGSADQSEE